MTTSTLLPSFPILFFQNPPHHVSPNPRSTPPPPHTLRLRKWLPRRKRRHWMPDCDGNRRIRERHNALLRNSLPVKLPSPNTINRRGHQLARPGLKLSALPRSLGNKGAPLGSVHSLKKSSPHLHRYVLTINLASKQRISVSIEIRVENPYVLDYVNCVSLLEQAMIGNGSECLWGPIVATVGVRRLEGGATRISALSLRRPSVQWVFIVCRGKTGLWHVEPGASPHTKFCMARSSKVTGPFQCERTKQKSCIEEQGGLLGYFVFQAHCREKVATATELLVRNR